MINGEIKHFPVTQSIKERRSVRRFQDKPIPMEVLRDILNCGRLAPSAYNSQPWLIGAVNDEELCGKIADIAENGRFIRWAAVCFAVFTRGDEKYYLEDGCAVTMNLILAAEAHGISSCWVAGDKKPYMAAVRELLNVPESYSLVSLVAAGYPEHIPSSVKKPLEEVVFFNRWNGSGAASSSAPPQRSSGLRRKIMRKLKMKLRKALKI